MQFYYHIVFIDKKMKQITAIVRSIEKLRLVGNECKNKSPHLEKFIFV